MARTSPLHTVKRRGHMERFDIRKLYKSCHSACLGSHLSEKEAKKICNEVTKAAKKWIKNKSAVSSDNIFRFVAAQLKKHNKEVAFMYKTHRDVS